MKLCQAKALGTLDDHQRRFGHVDTDFNDGRCDKYGELARRRAIHDLILVSTAHSAVDESNLVVAQAKAKDTRAFFGGGSIGFFALLDEWTNPISLASPGDMTTKALDDAGEAFFADNACFHGCATRRQLIDLADAHFSILSE